MNSGKTLRLKIVNNFDDLTETLNGSEIKLKYKKYNLCCNNNIYDENNKIILNCSEFEKKFDTYHDIIINNNITKLKFAKIKKFLEINKTRKKKEYSKKNNYVRYYYYLDITHDIILNLSDNKTKKIHNDDKIKKQIEYILDIYIYSSNKYINDGHDFIEKFISISPEWFINSHKKYDHDYIKNEKKYTFKTIKSEYMDYLHNYNDCDYDDNT